MPVFIGTIVSVASRCTLWSISGLWMGHVRTLLAPVLVPCEETNRVSQSRESDANLDQSPDLFLQRQDVDPVDQSPAGRAHKD